MADFQRSVQSLYTFAQLQLLICMIVNSFRDFKSDFLQIPRIGAQDGKIEIPQTLSQQSPLETILENTRLSSFHLIFSKIINFFNFHLRETFKPQKNVLDTIL